MLRTTKTTLASIAFAGMALFATGAAAVDIGGNKVSCRSHTDTKWHVPIGEGVSCRFEITEALQRDLMSKVGPLVVCEPLAAAMDAAGGGAEDPVADGIAAVVGVACPIALHQIINTYDKCKGMKIEARGNAKLKHKPGFHMQFEGCL